jgi:hypothetical protein
MSAQQPAATVPSLLPPPAGGVAPVEPHWVRRFWPWLLVSAFAIQVLARLYLYLNNEGAVVYPDEPGYLLPARILAGGPSATLPHCTGPQSDSCLWSIMRPMGYPLVISPAYWFEQVPSKVFVGVHIINALLMAANFPLLYVLGRRLFTVHRVTAAIVAFVVAVLPSLVFFGAYALTDALLPTLLAVLLLAIHEMVAGRRPWLGAIGAGLAAGYAANTHVRGLVMLAVFAALVLVATWRRWIGWRTAAYAAGSAAVSYVALSRVDTWLEAKLFPGTGAFFPDSRISDRLTTLAGLSRTLGDGFGQIWYLCTSTYGLAAIGIGAVIIMLVRREGALATRIVLGSALVMNVGIALATATGIPPAEHRENNHAYGRYVALFAGVWALVAVFSLARASKRRAVTLALVAAGVELGMLGMIWQHYNVLTHEVFFFFDAPEVAFFTRYHSDMNWLWMTGGTLVAIVILTVMLSSWESMLKLGRRVIKRRTLAMVALVGLLLLSGEIDHSISRHIGIANNNQQFRPGPPQLVRNVHIPVGSTIAEATDVPWMINQRQQIEAYWTELGSFDPSGGPTGSPQYVISETSWPGDRYGYVLDSVWVDRNHESWAVWRLANG